MAIRYIGAKKAMIRRRVNRIGRTNMVSRRTVSLKRRVPLQSSTAADSEERQKDLGKEETENIAARKTQESMMSMWRLSAYSFKAVEKQFLRYNWRNIAGENINKRPEKAYRRKAKNELMRQEAKKTALKRTMTRNRNRRRRKAAETIVRKIRDVLLIFSSAAGALIGLTLLVVLLSATFTLFGNTAAQDTHFKIEEPAKIEHESIGEFVADAATRQIGNDDGALYWEWYGSDDEVDWCACFVSWCWSWASLIEDEKTPYFAVCDEGITWFREKGQWREPFKVSGEGQTQEAVYYKPNPGEVLFFDLNGDGKSDHVGIVESSSQNTVTVIEGNSGGEVQRRWYAVEDVMIMGYGQVEFT